MRGRLITLVLMLIIALTVITGCGDDDEGGTPNVTEPSQTATTPNRQTSTGEDKPSSGSNSTDTSSATDGVTPPSAPPPPENIEDAVDQCVDGVSRYEMPERRKDQLRDVCRALGSNDEDRVREAAGKVCRSLIPKDAPDGDELLEQCISTAGPKAFQNR